MGKIDKDAIKALAREHNIAYYSAKMVLKEKWTMDYAKGLERPVFNLGVRWLLSAKKKKYVMAFRTFDKGVVLGKVLKVRKYNTLILCRGRLRYLEKIDTAFVYNSRIHRLLPEYVKRDPFVSDVKEKPAYKPSERKQADLSAIKEQEPVRITLYTGEIFEGAVNWLTDYDFEPKLTAMCPSRSCGTRWWTPSPRRTSATANRSASASSGSRSGRTAAISRKVRTPQGPRPPHGPRPSGPRPAGPRPQGPRLRPDRIRSPVKKRQPAPRFHNRRLVAESERNPQVVLARRAERRAGIAITPASRTIRAASCRDGSGC